MEESVLQRIRKIINLYSVSDRRFAEAIGVAQTTISSLFSRGSEPNISMVKSILNVYTDISPIWLITGEGPMLKSEVSTTPTPPTPPNNNNAVAYKLVPLLNLDAVGGIHSPNIVSGDNEYPDQLIPFTDAQEGDVALTVSGESMSPTCPPGSRVLIRQVPQWREYFGYGNIFVLLLTDGRRILKEVQKYPEDSQNYILCRSHNDRFPEEELPKSMISSVWKVIKILNERGW